MDITTPVRLRFDRGTLLLEGAIPSDVPGTLWDPRTSSQRAAAFHYGAVVTHLLAEKRTIVDDLDERWRTTPRDSSALGLRTYQKAALHAWQAFGLRGVIALATGAGKTRIAIAAIFETGLKTAILCPTRALAAEWVTELGRWIDEPIGLVGDGVRKIERITVLTFESAYRHMDRLGDLFGLLIVDEAHHFGSGARIEALECSAAVARLGLTATAPADQSPAAGRLCEVIGPTVFDMGYEELAGTHLAPVRVVRIPVALDDDERDEYARASRSFNEMARAFFRTNRGGDFVALLKALGGSTEGRRALASRARAEALASFPRMKRALVTRLVEEHRSDKMLVFTAFAENAYDVAFENLIPVIAAETSGRERLDILQRFREGKIRAIVSARVLNEGIDVPDARVAVIVAGMLGEREHVQRIGRVLRPAPAKDGKEKEALVYELVTTGTTDSRRAMRRMRTRDAS